MITVSGKMMISFDACMPLRALEKSLACRRSRFKRQKCEQIVLSCLLVLKRGLLFKLSIKTQVETAPIQICFGGLLWCAPLSCRQPAPGVQTSFFSLSLLNDSYFDFYFPKALLEISQLTFVLCFCRLLRS